MTGREGLPETGERRLPTGNDALVVGFEEDAQRVDDVVSTAEEGDPFGGAEDISALPGNGGRPGGSGWGGGYGRPVGLAGATRQRSRGG